MERTMPENEPWNAETDHVTVRVKCFFSFWDRLRLLWHGRAEVEAHVFAERHPGETRAESHAYIPRILPQKPETLVAEAPVLPYPSFEDNGKPPPTEMPGCGTPGCPDHPRYGPKPAD
jgi:hypothetical protein